MDFKKGLTQLNEKRGYCILEELIKGEPYIVTSIEVVPTKYGNRTVASLRKHSETIKVFLPDRFKLTQDFINSYNEDKDNTVTFAKGTSNYKLNKQFNYRGYKDLTNTTTLPSTILKVESNNVNSATRYTSRRTALTPPRRIDVQNNS
ncbi:hypothetical protein FQA39_LY09218 [Lamprigera yunnana]|nr:hypothetical protein FQA39_LY09218 [Lamprigera yunnana]